MQRQMPQKMNEKKGPKNENFYRAKLIINMHNYYARA